MIRKLTVLPDPALPDPVNFVLTLEAARFVFFVEVSPPRLFKTVKSVSNLSSAIPRTDYIAAIKLSTFAPELNFQLTRRG